MKHKCLCKGIITLCCSLCFSFFSPVLANEPISVQAAEAEIKLNVKTKSIVKGKQYALKVYNLTENQTVSFKSNNPVIASVNNTGLVSALSIGTTTITITVTDNNTKESSTLECDIIVGPPALHIQFSRTEYELTVGQRVFIEKIIQPLNTVEEAKFLSLDKNIATVSTGGFITAKNVGTTYISAKIDNGSFALCKVIVTDPSLEVQEDNFDSISEEFDDLATINDVAKSKASSNRSISSVSESTSEEFDDLATINEIAKSKALPTYSTNSVLESTKELDFESFLKELNANFANGDNTSENTDTTTQE